MKIRTQLILAFLLLAVVPLSVIVLYSYASSKSALEREAEAEASTLAQEMDGRMAAIRSELDRGVEQIGNVPYDAVTEAAQAGKTGVELGRIFLGMGQVASFVDSMEFERLPPAAKAPAPPAPPIPPSAPVPGGGVQSQGRPSVPAPPVVIDVNTILREVKAEVEASTDDPQAKEALAGALRMGEHFAREAVEEGRKAAALTGRERAARERTKARLVQRRLAFVPELEVPVTDRGEVVGMLKAQLKGEEVLRRVFPRSESRPGEIPFVVDAQGKLYTTNEEDRRRIEALPLFFQVHEHENTARWTLEDWVVVTRKDPQSGLVFGVARQAPLAEVRRTAGQNLGYGLGLIGLALFGILPFSSRLTRDLRRVTAGAERIAQGDLDTRLDVRSQNEIGTLALTFNRMAEDLKQHQEREVEQALLHTEYERKTRELEEARSFQLSLLPKALPEHPAFEIAVSMRTATEVGGDYYDFHLSDEGVLTTAIGDATGHGVRAGTMVTAVKSLFSAFAGRMGPRDLLGEAARAVKRMALDRMAMGLALARLEGGTLTVSSAGMPPVLVRRAATGTAEEIALAGMPLGGLAFDYEERRLEVASGDTLLLMTDGLPELTDANGDPLGYPQVRTLFAELGSQTPEEIIAGLTAAAETWTGGEAVRDDITLVVVRVR